MLLQELAERSGVSVASIKYYRREGLLPPGSRITATRQDYGRRHLERLALIGTLREEAGASIEAVRALTRVLDDEQRPLVDALELAQAVAAGLPAEPHQRPVPDDEHPLVRDLLHELGWPDTPTGPRAALDELLRGAETNGVPVPRAALLRYGRVLGDLAEGDLAAVRSPVPDGAPGAWAAGQGCDTAGAPPSRDVVVDRAVQGMVTYERLARVLRALGHASLSIVAASDDATRPLPDPLPTSCTDI